MRFAMVTLGYEEVDWIDPNAEMRDACFSDSKFAAWLSNQDLVAALEQISVLHRHVGNQLARAGTTKAQSDWETRAVSLAIRLKHRRQEVRQMLRELLGDEAVLDLIRSFETSNPRAPHS